jgi:hypothetical protein
MEYIKTITELENKILRINILDIQEYYDNIFDSQLYSTKQIILPIIVKKCLEENVPIPNTENLIIELGFEKGWIKESENQETEQMGDNNG